MSPRGSVERRIRDQLDRIASVNDGWRIFVGIDADGALAAAARCDRRHADGRPIGPLDGVSVAIKDNIDVADLPTGAGIGAFRDNQPDADAGVVARLREAGAVVLGKLNMHEGALGATTDNPFYGRCANPLAPDHTPGGSSGGSAAAVAAGLADLTLGTDTMGSVRIPAAYCGVWGLKPTAGLVGRSGLLHLSWSMDTVGLLAASPGLLADGLGAIAGLDDNDPASAAPPEDWSTDIRTLGDLSGVILGRPIALDGIALQPGVAAAYAAATASAESQGASIQNVDIPGWQPGRLRRSGLLAVEAEAAFLLADAIARDPNGFSQDFRRLLDYGSAAPAIKLAGAYHRLRQVGHDARRVLAGVDALIMPTAPQIAFPHDAPAPVDQADLTALANAAGCPALSFPWPGGADGLPAGIQLVGAAFSEGRLLSLAAAISGSR